MVRAFIPSCACLVVACRPVGDTGAPLADPAPVEDLLAWVDPLIGTGGQGFGQGTTYPGPALPFGMVAASPDTRSTWGHIEATHAGGYWYDDPYIVGFSHLHLSGAGAADWGNVQLYPAPAWDEAFTDPEGRATPYTHEGEAAAPGYYAVTFENGIRTELTASHRAAVHRYTFPPGATPTLVLDLEHALASGGGMGGSLAAEPEAGIVAGHMRNAGSLTGRYGGVEIHLDASFDPPPVAWGAWGDGAPEEGATAAEGTDLGAWFQWAPAADGTVVEARVGISFTSEAAARVNREAELGGRTFEDVRREAETTWREALGRFHVWGGTDEERTIFATALYHSLLMPDLMSDVGGAYIGFDGAEHWSPWPFWSDFSMWDTYRTLHPLLTLAWPEQQALLARSLVTMARQGGYLPRWPCGHGYTGCMVGDPADIVLADTWIKGVRGWDGPLAFRAARVTADGPVPKGAPFGGRSCVVGYLDRGWVAADERSGSVSWTLEYAWADHALARWAEALGLPDLAAEYDRRAGSWRNVYDAETGFFRGRDADGTFGPASSFSDTAWEDEYVEGTAWQYLWMVPQDPWGLAEVLGGRDATLDRLDLFFELSAAQEDTFLPDPYYWHGNEPDLHAPWLYALLGAPERGAPWLRHVRETRYRATPDGLDGNDDGGTLSAWYVWSAMGLYPVAGTETYALGPPVFPRLEVDLPAGTLVVVHDPDPAAPEAWREVLLDGVPVDGGTLTHAQVASGGEIVFR